MTAKHSTARPVTRTDLIILGWAVVLVAVAVLVTAAALLMSKLGGA
ncbi:hypothetical protein EV379_1209 [Microterricola gilva]|uniref:Uncharacterized protein n=1 Tax=Microterricola gilva TaxID=393267 RepID=A0A4Q8AKH3_9MICO|nr:hypothetical protein [Microterricola gilva]RZU64898.1 hypothetical protein EV379_1209 [Microterricola gilva]